MVLKNNLSLAPWTAFTGKERSCWQSSCYEIHLKTNCIF